MLSIAAAACLVLAGCAGKETVPDHRILVVDTAGTPLEGAVVYPDSDDSSSQTPRYAENHSTDKQGLLVPDLEEFYWDSDGCYHFRVRSPGYEEETVAVSRDLFPFIYRIELRPREHTNPPLPPHRS
ncbi:MAG TPA: hypothetical protein VGG34_09300 [Opitutaceae bacterium]|jgi:hypothetical protein